MTSYNILRWDLIFTDNQKRAMIYIKPDYETMLKLNENGTRIAKVSGTGLGYDDIHQLNFSSINEQDTENNLYEGCYTSVIPVRWLGYPILDNFGSVEITFDDDIIQEELQVTKKSSCYMGICKTIVIFLILLLGFLIIRKILTS